MLGALSVGHWQYKLSRRTQHDTIQQFDDHNTEDSIYLIKTVGIIACLQQFIHLQFEFSLGNYSKRQLLRPFPKVGHVPHVSGRTMMIFERFVHVRVVDLVSTITQATLAVSVGKVAGAQSDSESYNCSGRDGWLHWQMQVKKGIRKCYIART